MIFNLLCKFEYKFGTLSIIIPHTNGEPMELNLIKLMFGKLLQALRFDKPQPKDFGIQAVNDREVEHFSLKSDGLTIRGKIMFPGAKPSMQYPALIICHGIPGSGTPRASDDPGYDSLLDRFSGIGLAAVFFNFRGCGDSEGDFDMMGWTRDLRAVVDKVANTPHIDPTRINLLGFSGGAAAAINVSADNSNIFALASVCSPATFEIFEKDPNDILDDFRERGLIKSIDFPKDVNQWMNSFKEVQPEKWIGFFKGKSLLIVHGDADELIPLSQAEELYKKAPAGIKELEIIHCGEHRLRTNPECLQILEDWFIKTMGWKR